MAHSVSPAPRDATAGPEEPSVGTLVQSAMADISTLVRSEIELAKAEVGKSAKKAGISVGLVHYYFGSIEEGVRRMRSKRKARPSLWPISVIEV